MDYCPTDFTNSAYDALRSRSRSTPRVPFESLHPGREPLLTLELVSPDFCSVCLLSFGLGFLRLTPDTASHCRVLTLIADWACG